MVREGNGLSNDELLAKLERWLATLPAPPTIFDVMERRDPDLFAAFVLKTFRAAARRSTLCKIQQFAGQVPGAGGGSGARGVVRILSCLVRKWCLTEDEQLALFGLESTDGLTRLRKLSDDKIPPEIVERTAYLLDIYIAIGGLLTDPERAALWIRAPNKAPLFGGRSALELMMASLHQMRLVKAHLQSQT